MPNKIKLVDSSADNILTSNFKDVGTDGSGQSNVGSREFINPNWLDYGGKMELTIQHIHIHFN